MKQFNSDINDNWIVGGQGLRSELTAKSENINLTSQKIYISVDVPVYDINVDINVDDQGEQATEGDVREIALGSTFVVDTTFTPGDSQYLFGDSSNTTLRTCFPSCFLTLKFVTYSLITSSIRGNLV